jgi:mRNA interferase MazF
MGWNKALQGEVWLFDPDPTKGTEIGKKIRPGVIISNDFMNQGPSDLVFIIPLTSVSKGIASHIPIKPPEGGLTVLSFALCEQMRCISTQRLIKKLGTISSKKILREMQQWIHDLIHIED